MAQSGNRPPRRSQSTKSGSRPPGQTRQVSNGLDESAAERARERLAQRNTSGQKAKTASQRARSAPAAPRTKAQAAAAQRARSGGPASRRGTAGRAPQRSTAMTAAIFGTVLVVLAVLVIVLVSVTGSKAPGAKGFGTKPIPPSVLNDITKVPASAFTAAGALADQTNGPYPTFVAIKPSQPALSLGGKPLVVYIGSNWCPYCAATRWPLVVALARFGTFKGLTITKSGVGAGSAAEIYPKTNTLSFHGTTYTSPYLALKAVEQCSDLIPSKTSAAVQACNGYVPLETLGGIPAKVFLKYNYPPFQTQANQGGIPFIDMGNKYSEDGAFINPAILQGLTWQQIAQSLGTNPAALPAQPIVVGANYYTAAICKLTHSRPGSVCNMPVIKQAAKLLKL
jgi:hypothetical protein